MANASEVKIKFFERQTAEPEHPGCDWAEIAMPEGYFTKMLILKKMT